MKKVIGVLTVSIFLTGFYPVNADAVTAGSRTGEKYDKVQVYEPMKCYGLEEKSIENDPIYKGKAFNEDDIKAARNSEKEKESYERLVPKTNDNYEVALSYEDGSYTFAGSTDTYENAVAMADLKENSSEVTMSNQVVVPTVINAEGDTVYATESIGRVWKNYAPGAGNDRTSLSYIYTDSSMRDTYTYISDSYISEVPIVRQDGDGAQVLVAGYKGWMNTNINRTTGEYDYPNKDLRIVPVTDVTNPSHYTVSGGTLYHYVSTSMSTAGSGSTLAIGKAPSYLQEGKTYYSYDGNYFYDGSNGTASALVTLMRDLKSGSYSNAINKGNPYYNYYNYLPFRSQTSYSADEINRFIDAKTKDKPSSKLKGTGQLFINAQNKYGVNALLALGIAINESAWGTSNYAVNRNNLFGINATDDNTNANTSYYASIESCIDYFAKNLISRGYANPSDWRDYGGFLGDKEFGANVYYASDPYWSEKAANYAFTIDNYLSGGARDYNKYQLLLNTSACSVVNSSGSGLYNVLSSVSTRGSHVGAVSTFSKNAVVVLNGQTCYAINPEITSSLSSRTFDGNYNWGVLGYIPMGDVKLINEGKNYFDDEDVNMDAQISTLDLTNAAKQYNITSSSSLWNARCDINHDGIVDIYDLVKISSKL